MEEGTTKRNLEAGVKGEMEASRRPTKGSRDFNVRNRTVPITKPQYVHYINLNYQVLRSGQEKNKFLNQIVTY